MARQAAPQSISSICRTNRMRRTRRRALDEAPFVFERRLVGGARLGLRLIDLFGIDLHLGAAPAGSSSRSTPAGVCARLR